MDKCKRCGSTNIAGVEYDYDHPDHYDGVSEWDCLACGLRVGRWSGAILTGEPRNGEHATEPRYGVER